MRTAIIVLALTVIYGCSTLGALNRLKDLSLTRDEQERCLKEQEDKFQQLLKDFSAGKIEKGVLKSKIIAIYSEPISTKKIKTGSSLIEVLMYRHPSQFFGSERLFLYFSSNNKLIGIKYEK